MERFNLKTWLEDKSRKIVTRDGKQARIICYDVKQGRRDDCYVPIIALIDKGEEIGEMSYYYSEDGSFLRSHNQTHNLDLFFAEDEDSMNEFETRIYNLIISDPHNYPSIKEIKEEAEILLELAKNEIDKSNPYSGISFEYNGHIWGMCARDNGVDILFDNELIQHISGEMQGEQKTEIEHIYPRFRIGDVIEPIKPNGFHRPVRVLSIEKKTKSYYCESDDKKSFSSIPIKCEDEYKLVEQKLAWNKDDERMFSGLISIVEDWYNTMSEEEKEYYGDCGYINWINSLKDRVQPQPKPEWSEEDEKMLNEIQDSLRINNGTNKMIKYECWFDDIKDKIQPKPKQEWGEEDEQNRQIINKAIWEYIGENCITQGEAGKLIQWLKSLKTNHWKPSEKQLTDLYYAAKQLSETRPNLQILYNDIKQL